METKKIGMKGFTLIEVLIVIGIIAILAAVVIVALNPARNFGQANDTLRKANLNAILSANSQYTVDSRGTLPAAISTTETEICKTGVAQATCSSSSLIYLGELASGSRYGLDALPSDPSCPTGCAANGIGYTIFKTGKQVTVCAPGMQEEAKYCLKR